MNTLKKLSLLSAAVCFVATACKNDDTKEEEKPVAPQLQAYSVTPSLVKPLAGFESIKMYPLISSDDKLSGSPDFIYGAQPDGGGMLKNPNGEGFIMINNHEILYSVSRVYLDKNLKPVKGEYIVDAEGGQYRLCSATLVTPQEHGFGPTFLTAGETNGESMTHAIDPLATADKKNKSRTITAFGKWSAENAVPLPKDAFPGKTVIVIGEDHSEGQLVVYVSNTVGDLANGKLYVLKRTDNNTVETDIVKGQVYDVELVELDNVKTSKGSELSQQTVDKKAIQFARVEDVDYRKGGGANGREVYFTATGVSSDLVTPVAGKNMWGRVYRMIFDATNPLKGKLELVAEGDTEAGTGIINPDNLCVTQNYVYIQEDGDSFYTNAKHDSRVWQYSIASKALKPMLEANHKRTDAAFNAKYNTVNVNKLGSWEFGAMYDISDLTGIPDTFILNIHPHTWQEDKFKNADGSVVRERDNKEGGQTIILSGIAR